MNKVYVVTANSDNDDEAILAVFSKVELANKFVKDCKKSGRLFENHYIGEYEIDYGEAGQNWKPNENI